MIFAFSGLPILETIFCQKQNIVEISFKGQNEFHIFTRLSKFVSGIHSNASNFAVLSEFAQHPVVNCIMSGI